MIVPRTIGFTLFVLWAIVMWQSGMWQFSASTVSLPTSTSWREVFIRSAAWPLSIIVLILCGWMLLHPTKPWPHPGVPILGVIVAAPIWVLFTGFHIFASYLAFGVLEAHQALAESTGGEYRPNPSNRRSSVNPRFPMRAIVDLPDGHWVALTLYRAGGSGLGLCVLSGTAPDPQNFDFEARWRIVDGEEKTDFGKTVRRVYEQHDALRGHIADVQVRDHRLLVARRRYRTEAEARELVEFTRHLASELRDMRAHKGQGGP